MLSGGGVLLQPVMNSVSQEGVNVLLNIAASQSQLLASALTDPVLYSQSLEWSFFLAGVSFALIFAVSLGYTYYVDATIDGDFGFRGKE